MFIRVEISGPGVQAISYLLGKHPRRVFCREVSGARVLIFYEAYEPERVVVILAALHDPLHWTPHSEVDLGIEGYVNDRPFALSSLTCTYLTNCLREALQGKCREYPDLVDQVFDVRVTLLPFSLDVRHPYDSEVFTPQAECAFLEPDIEQLRDLFEPLGYQTSVDIRGTTAAIVLQGRQTVPQVLRHLYVLIPAIDGGKHGPLGEAEMQALLRYGEGWLARHPKKGWIVNRYLRRYRVLVNASLESLKTEDESAEEEEESGFIPLAHQRRERILAVLNELGVESVLDLGCGEGKLTHRLAEQGFRATGADIDEFKLRRAMAQSNELSRRPRFELSSLYYYDERLAGHEAIVLCEVIEHLPVEHLKRIEEVIFSGYAPQMLVLTTPNREYNINYGLAGMRHPDHVFEWTRQELQAWCEQICAVYPYTFKIEGVGEVDSQGRQPTSLAVFIRQGFVPRVRLPQRTLAILIGPSGSGKSFWAQQFPETYRVATDRLRALVSDREDDQTASRLAHQLAYALVEARMQFDRPIIMDATGLRADHRQHLLELARQYHYRAVAVLFPEVLETCLERQKGREHPTPQAVVKRQHQQMQEVLKVIHSEGFDRVFDTPPRLSFVPGERITFDIDAPGFDIIGDVHGCYTELTALLHKLGYDRSTYTHPKGRVLVFVGDLADRGPENVKVLELVMQLVQERKALYTPGNHCVKLMRWCCGHRVRISEGLERTIEEIMKHPDARSLSSRIARFIQQAPPYLILDHGRLIVAHAGLTTNLIGRTDRQARSFALYGDVIGQDEHGHPIRRDWAADYSGQAFIVYGHTPVKEPTIRNNTVNIDTGCVFGGALSCLRYPEKEIVSVPSGYRYEGD